MIKLIILGKCLSKDNNKSFGRQGRFYLPKKFKDYEDSVALQARMQYKGPPLPKEASLWLRMFFYMPDLRHCDLLNLPKGICDALTGIIWVDDKQITLAELILNYDKDRPRVEIEVIPKYEEKV